MRSCCSVLLRPTEYADIIGVLCIASTVMLFTFMHEETQLSQIEIEQMTLARSAPSIPPIMRNPVAYQPAVEKSVLNIDQAWSAYIKTATADAGRFTPTRTCPTPKLWIMLFGGYRTFHYSKHALADFAQNSVGGDCWFVVLATKNEAVAPENIAKETTGNRKQMSSVDYSRMMAGRTFEQLLQADSLELDGRLAYVTYDHIEDMDGKLKYEFYEIAWYAGWKMASAVATTYNFTIDPLSVVMRIRPDVVPRAYVDVDAVYRHFHTTPGSWRVHLGGLITPDMVGLTSYQAWDRLVCKKIANAKNSVHEDSRAENFFLANLNAWGYSSLATLPNGSTFDVSHWSWGDAKGLRAPYFPRLDDLMTFYYSPTIGDTHARQRKPPEQSTAFKLFRMADLNSDPNAPLGTRVSAWRSKGPPVDVTKSVFCVHGLDREQIEEFWNAVASNAKLTSLRAVGYDEFNAEMMKVYSNQLASSQSHPRLEYYTLVDRWLPKCGDCDYSVFKQCIEPSQM